MNTAQTLIEALQCAAENKDRDANQLDRWARESRSGGWSTHQVDPMMKMADKLRREAADIRQLITVAVEKINTQ